MDVKTARRTVDLFELFAKARTPLTLSEVARALDAPQSSCFNLLRAMEGRGFLYSVGGGKRVYPTRKLLDIAEAIAGYDPVLPRVEEALETLREATQETVILGKRQGERVVYLAVVEGPQTIRYISRAGELKPLHASAIGKALLMPMPDAERTALIARLSLDAATDRTLTDATALEADVVAARTRGWSETRGEHVADVMAVAVPLRLDGLDYAVAVAGPIARMAPVAREHAAAAKAAFSAL